jgi:dipeptidyl aminopeptidase/acylaminoacyl peptidase
MFLSDGEQLVAWRTGRAGAELVLYPSARSGRAVARVAAPPPGATVLKAWGKPPSLACLGSDVEGTRRVFAWVAGLSHAPQPVTPARQRVGDFAFAPASVRFAWTHQNPWRVGQPPPAPALFLDEVGGTGPVRVEVPAAPLGYLAWDVSGRYLAWLARPEGALLAHPELWVLDVERREATRLLSEADGWVTGFDWTHEPGRLVAAVESGVVSGLWRLDVEGMRRALDAGDTSWRAPSCARAKDGMVALWQDVHRAPRGVWRGADGVPRVVTDNHLAADAALLRPAVTRTWTGRDGRVLEGLWVAPATPGPHPTIVWLHGGPAEHVGRGFSVLFQGLVDAGYALFAPNVRGSTGRGDDFLRALEGRLCAEDVEDLDRGVRSLITEGLAHRRRVGLFGWSYGGSLALMTAAGRPWVRAVVAGAPVVDWLSVFGAKTWPHVTAAWFGAQPWEEPARYDAASPARRLAEVQAPVLLLHGEEDDRVPVSQSRLAFHLLGARGVQTDLRLFPRQGHVFRDDWARAELLARVVDWMGAHLADDEA